MKKLLIGIVLVLLTVSAFVIRLENFRRADSSAIDEVVFFRMALQMTRDLSAYHTMPYGKDLAATGRELPQYFFDPIFKHPPVFTLLATASMRIFGPTMLSVEYVSLASAVLMIPLVYWLSAMVFGRIAGLLSAFLLWLDPVHIITSQKAWMDSTVSFFPLLAAALFVYGLKNNRDLYFILSGIAGGLAVNTKYTGALITVVFILFALLYRRDLFKRPAFNISLLLPFFLLLPWFFWNCQVYGWKILSRDNDINDTGYLLTLLGDFRLWGGGLVVVLGTILFLRLRRSGYEPSIPKTLPFANIFLFVAFAVIFLQQAIMHSLQFTYLPKTSWAQGLFSGEPTWFYFERLIEYSFFYFFAFAALFIHDETVPHEAAVLRLSAGLFMVFFIAWGNYQSRYIFPAVPFLLILAAAMIQKIYSKLSSFDGFLPRTTSVFLFLLFIGYAVLKITYINEHVSFPHDFCYY